ncbi:unnamed protein product [Trichogramma brassicae]|uniref:Uncharacterized protein n=1 Tax=Trichogramma brassicae TaxID=86971 RepID=A0A6H5I303_9HYME|nr:unnamed protein product [Trichogramma brassicae]
MGNHIPIKRGLAVYAGQFTEGQHRRMPGIPTGQKTRGLSGAGYYTGEDEQVGASLFPLDRVWPRYSKTEIMAILGGESYSVTAGNRNGEQTH